jgi:hypothetical protein
MMKRILITAAGAAAIVLIGACGPTESARTSAEEHRPVHVDSIFPIEEEIRRFRATLDDHPTELAEALDAREALVRAFVAAIESEDLAAAERLRLTRAEFAYLYYPFTRYTARPYELAPGLVWFQFENHGGRGINRAMQRYGGSPIGYVAHRCDADPTVEEGNRIHTGCVVERVRDDGERESIPVLGPILEREGRFKFLSFANGL